MGPQSSRKAQVNREVPVHGIASPVAYFVSAPHPPSERQTDAGQLPPWLLGVALFGMKHRGMNISE
jgi:hypothetical protein